MDAGDKNAMIWLQVLADLIASDIAGRAPGSVVLLDFLPQDEALQLRNELRERTEEQWQVEVVGQSGEATIGADTAVDLREDVSNRLFFMILRSEAGPGLQGVYDVADVIDEIPVLQRVRRQLRSELKGQDADVAHYVRKAEDTARFLAGGRKPDEEVIYAHLAYYSAIMASDDLRRAAGNHLDILGLIPEEDPDPSDTGRLSQNADAVRTLLGHRRRSRLDPINERVAQLGLEEEQVERELEQVLSEHPPTPNGEWLSELRRQDLDFSRWRVREPAQEPDEIQIRSFYQSGGAPYKWTGLTEAEGQDYLVFSLHDDARSDSFEIRWDVSPGELADSACAYRLSLISATTEQPLLEDRLEHKKLKRSYQKWVVGCEDLEDYEGGEYVVRVVVQVEGSEDEPKLTDESEDFLLTSELFATASTASGSAKETRSLADASFAYALRKGEIEDPSIDTREEGYTLRFPGSRIQLVRCPSLLRDIERAFIAEGDTPSYAELELAPDGTPITDSLEVHPIETPDGHRWERYLRGRRAVLSAIEDLCDDEDENDIDPTVEGIRLDAIAEEVSEYSRSAQNALQALVDEAVEDDVRAPNLMERYAELLRSDTCLVKRRRHADDTEAEGVAVLVAPTHPLRLLWLLSYEQLLLYWLGETEEQPNTPLLTMDRADRRKSVAEEALEELTAQHFPAFAAWTEGELWQYFGSLGLFWGIMLPVGESDPQGQMSEIREAIDFPSGANAGMDVSADVLSEKVEEYLRLHPFVNTLRINAHNPGDGAMQEAMFRRLLTQRADDAADQDRPLSIDFKMIVGDDSDYQKVGRRFDIVAAKRLRGEDLTNDELSLMAGSGDALHPHFVWSRLGADETPPPAHMSLLVDQFRGMPASVGGKGASENPEAYGLALHLSRQLHVDDGLATFMWWVEPTIGDPGSRHPVDGNLTRELSELHRTYLNFTHSVNTWSPDDRLPAVRVQVDQSTQEMLSGVHRSSDWVMTLDRHLGVEYFDYPECQSSEFERYLIDYAPEYVDRTSHQLAISTERIEELQELLRGAAEQLGMIPRPEALRKIISLLSSVSGHLAMQISNRSRLNEIVAISVVRQFMEAQEELGQGILLPVDVHRRLFSSKTDEPDRRCDLLMVSPDTHERRDVVRFDFIEVKYRRHRNLAASRDLRDTMLEQTEGTDRGLRDQFFPQEQPLDITLKRRELVRILRFYLDRAKRAGLIEEEPAAKLHGLLGQMLLPDYDRLAPSRYRAFVYCPEIDGTSQRDELLHRGQLEVTTLGRGALPKEATEYADETEEERDEGHQKELGKDTEQITGGSSCEQDEDTDEDASEKSQSEDKGEVVNETDADEAETSFDGPVEIEIGTNVHLDRPVFFQPTIKGNPHLMIVGIPGMGKTTVVINAVATLAKQGVFSLVTDFHGDLTERLADAVPADRLRILDASEGLPFNPMRLTEEQLSDRKGWVANAIEIAEIWGGIFPDFGDIQEAEIRDRLMQAYQETGYGREGCDEDVPAFSRFYELLQKDRDDSKSIRNVCARLDPIFLMGIFREGEDEFVLDDLTDTVVCLDLHGLAQETNQLVAASFFLHKIYKEMFLRGAVEELCQYLVFDEAHRAAGLRLLGRFMQESRKFGIGVIASSQRVSDFSDSVLETPGNHMALQVNQTDARRLANVFAGGKTDMRTKLQNLGKFRAVFRSEDYSPHVEVNLKPPIWE